MSSETSFLNIREGTHGFHIPEQHTRADLEAKLG